MAYKDFYFYSNAVENCIIQLEKSEEYAWKLNHIGNISKQTDLREKITDLHDKDKYLVTTELGDEGGREKVESRPITNLFNAINWAEYIQDINPNKIVKVWMVNTQKDDKLKSLTSD